MSYEQYTKLLNNRPSYDWVRKEALSYLRGDESAVFFLPNEETYEEYHTAYLQNKAGLVVLLSQKDWQDKTCYWCGGVLGKDAVFAEVGPWRLYGSYRIIYGPGGSSSLRPAFVVPKSYCPGCVPAARKYATWHGQNVDANCNDCKHFERIKGNKGKCGWELGAFYGLESFTVYPGDSVGMPCFTHRLPRPDDPPDLPHTKRNGGE